MVALPELGNSVLVGLPGAHSEQDPWRRYTGQDHDPTWMLGDFAASEAAPAGARPSRQDSTRTMATTTETMTTFNSTTAMTTYYD